MVQSFEDVTPSGDEVTSYDRDHTMLYIYLLDRQKRGQDWRTTVRAFFGRGSEHEPDRARAVYGEPFGAHDCASERPVLGHDAEDGLLFLVGSGRCGSRLHGR